ncbi:MAG: hypothetical protein ACR2HI_08115 [Gaiella sp.]
MSPFVTSSSGGIARGAWCGTVAAMAMSGVRAFTTSVGLVDKPPPDEIATEGAPAVFARVPVRYRDASIELAHWGYGAGMGVAYGALPDSLRRRSLTGPAYGLAIWAFFERGVAPVLGLRTPRERPLRERAAIVADHLLYGVVVAGRPHGS